MTSSNKLTVSEILADYTLDMGVDYIGSQQIEAMVKAKAALSALVDEESKKAWAEGYHKGAESRQASVSNWSSKLIYELYFISNDRTTGTTDFFDTYEKALDSMVCDGSGTSTIRPVSVTVYED